MEEKFMRLDQFKPRWRFVMLVVELVNLVESVLLILGLIADFLISHTANLNLLLYI
jgi:cell shape-determining protein MreD